MMNASRIVFAVSEHNLASEAAKVKSGFVFIAGACVLA